jgi:hypothetical protein
VALSFAAAGCGSSAPADRAAPAPDRAVRVETSPGSCDPPPVHHTPYPGGDRSLDGIPWIEGEPRESGLVGLLWYWREEWGRSREARIFTGGVAPEGYNAKVLWAFLAPSAKDRGGRELVIRGRRLDGRGRFRDSFAAIGYEGQRGAPSYASIVEVPAPGCWRLTLTTGELRATVDLRAVDLAGEPSPNRD